MKKRLERLGRELPGEEALARPISRRQLVAGAGATSLALLLAACGGGDGEAEPAATTEETPPADTGETPPADTGETPPAETPGLAGVAGGFSGFEGAERYSWTEDSAAGRAIALAQKLKADGKAPDKLVVGSYAGSIGAYEEPFPEGAQAVNALWEELTGIKIEFVGIPPEQVFPKTVQMAATKDGSQNLIQMDYHSTGTLAEAGLIIPLTEWVDAYQPDWDDPETGYIGAPLTTQAFNYYNGEPYAVAQDGDLQVFYVRKDLFEDSKEQADFKAKYGYDLAPPKTWDEHRDMAEFFHRPDQGLFGATDLRSPAWGWINFVHRYVSTANPVQFYFDDEMNPLVNSEQGLKALNDLIETTKFGSPDALTWTWEQQYPNWGARGAAMTVGFNNMTKFITAGSPLDTADAGSVTSAFPMPGWDVDGTLVRHNSIYFNASWGINQYADPKYREAAFAYMLWTGYGKIYTLINANPAGYQDVARTYALTDPLAVKSYTQRTMDVLGATYPGHAPSFSGALNGAYEYIQGLEINMLEALSGQASPEQSLASIESAWQKATDKLGRETQIAAWQTSKAGWPTTPDSAGADFV
ncbi:MAG: extracellular solute-binding protein [Thermoleophilia bacterium]|nr:extracellular solute-binding protein [Thermoleophilia bacterium]